MKIIAKLQIIIAAMMVLGTVTLGIKNVVLLDFSIGAILVAAAFTGMTSAILLFAITEYKQLKKQQ